jgi:hypothetical protein
VNLRDRRRLTFATLVTLLALPALLLVNRDSSSGSPNVAAAGVQVENGYVTAVDAADPSAPAASGPSTANLPDPEPIGEAAPVFLDGPAANGGGLLAIAVPTVPEGTVQQLQATYTSQVWDWTCIVPGVSTGTTVTIVNVDNGRSTTCVATYGDPRADGRLVMHTNDFLKLADLTDAPIPVEIRT